MFEDVLKDAIVIISKEEGYEQFIAYDEKGELVLYCYTQAGYDCTSIKIAEVKKALDKLEKHFS